MPITVSNDLPYAVSVQVNSLTDSMQIVTSRTADIDIPSHSDAQVTFTIRVSTSGSSTAHVSLTDREGNSFGNTQDTAITSVMRISDASGFIIIASPCYWALSACGGSSIGRRTPTNEFKRRS